MKCRYREKADDNLGQKLRNQYAKLFVDHLGCAIALSLAENFGFRSKRLQRLMSRLPDEFMHSMSTVTADEYFIDTRQGRKKANMETKMKDAMATEEIRNERVLSGIGFVPNLMEDLDVEREWLEKWRSIKGDYQAAFMRASWYVNWEWRIARVFVGDCLILLNTIYGFGKIRLERWYKGFLPYYRKYVELFIGMNSVYDDRLLYHINEVKKKLSNYRIEFEVNDEEFNIKSSENEPQRAELPELGVKASLLRERII